VAELVLSASSADAYRTCPWRWYLEYVEQVGTTTSVAACVGLAVHGAIEAYFKLKLDGQTHEDITLPEVWEGLQDEYDMLLSLELASVMEPDEDVKKARVQGRRVLVSYLEDVGSKITPLFVEEALRIDVNGIPYSIHPDLIDDKIVVHDTKVKRQKPRDPGVYAFAQNGYGLGSRVLTGRKETDLVLDIMIRLKRDRPYHVPIRNGGPVTDYAAGVFASQLEWVANGIAANHFPPSGLETGACRYCPVRAHCDYFEEMERAQSS
jgi:hypothetical protein